LPGCFLSYNYDMVQLPPVAPPPSLAKGFVTFGCFGSGGKLNGDLIAIWARLLALVPGAQVYLRNQELTPGDNRQFMLDRFRRRGIGPDRVRLEGGGSRDDILRSYDEVDISLDTWPYCGGNTVAESLWQGVPVVTLKGSRFVSRYGASLLRVAGCRELVGETEEEYIDIAAALVSAPARLTYYRNNLRTMARQFGFSDVEGFARKLDDAYLAMMRTRAN
jgi:predicted O-linked N-acetylglucosamine transferase (SPINDLY family)